MLEFDAIIDNKIGMHLRAAGEFVQVANRFQSEILVVKDGKKANGKSILGLASLAIERGAVITIQIDGDDEEDAREALEELIDAKFYED
ncbi:MAG: HPr family phosphocarrier protein [bacterium]